MRIQKDLFVCQSHRADRGRDNDERSRDLHHAFSFNECEIQHMLTWPWSRQAGVEVGGDQTFSDYEVRTAIFVTSRGTKGRTQISYF